MLWAKSSLPQSEDAKEVLKCAHKKLASETEKLSRYAAEGIDIEAHAARIQKSLDAKAVYME